MNARNDKLDLILAEARPRIAEHWSSCLKAGLRGYTPATVTRLDELIDRYFAELKALPDGAPSTEMLLCIKTFFSRVDELMAAVGVEFLETDDREVLVPIITEAAAAAGLDTEKFEGGDPTLEFRHF